MPAVGSLQQQLPFGAVACRIHGFAHFTFGLVQIQSLAATAISRYLCVCHSRTRWEVKHELESIACQFHDLRLSLANLMGGKA